THPPAHRRDRRLRPRRALHEGDATRAAVRLFGHRRADPRHAGPRVHDGERARRPAHPRGHQGVLELAHDPAALRRRRVRRRLRHRARDVLVGRAAQGARGLRGALSAAVATTDRLGRPLHDLRISVTDRCNFRCPYCMPAEIYGERYEFLAKPELLSFEEIERLARIFVALGVEKLRITGGEPLLRHDLPALIAALARVEGVRDLTLTTNGYLLAAQARGLAD